MKKGDLVRRKDFTTDEDYFIPWFDTGILLTSPYAAVFTHKDEKGESIYSHERAVVDLVANSKIIQKCPIEFIIKIGNE